MQKMWKQTRREGMTYWYKIVMLWKKYRKVRVYRRNRNA
jgi:hypothetical protein